MWWPWYQYHTGTSVSIHNLSLSSQSSSLLQNGHERVAGYTRYFIDITTAGNLTVVAYFGWTPSSSVEPATYKQHVMEPATTPSQFQMETTFCLHRRIACPYQRVVDGACYESSSAARSIIQCSRDEHQTPETGLCSGLPENRNIVDPCHVYLRRTQIFALLLLWIH